jgi:NAD dependent epimerase/dehydratase family enzyme
MLTEDEPPGDDFLAEVGRDWEKEALKAESKGTRVILTRFGIVLNRPAVVKAPAFMILLGEFGKVLLESQQVRPAKLERAGFKFEYPDIDSALEQIVRG